jgi:hypothetical protein
MPEEFNRYHMRKPLSNGYKKMPENVDEIAVHAMCIANKPVSLVKASL